MLNPDNPQRQRREAVRAVLPVTVLGLFVAAVGVLLMQWPTFQTNDSAIATTFHLNRVIDRISAGDIPGALTDGLIYGLLIVGAVCVAMAWSAGRIAALMGLAIAGLMGLAYVSGVALYNGPMIAVLGFALITLSGVVAWAIMASEPPDEVQPGEGTANTEPVPAAPVAPPIEAPIETTTESASAIVSGSGYDDASHSVA